MIIYKLTNILDGKTYIGKTTQKINRRWSGHKAHNDGSYIHNAIQDHGQDNFKLEILKECETREIMGLMETFMIMVHKSHYTEGGYNLTWGNDGNNGHHHSPESIEKMRAVHRKENLSPDTIRRLSESRQGRKPNLGNKHTPETIEKLRQASIGNKYGLGYKYTPELRELRRKARMGYKHSPETRQKMREAAILRWNANP